MIATKKTKEAREGVLFVLPAVLHLLIFAGLPILYAAYLSLFKWNILRGVKPFVGIENYIDTLQNPAFWGAMWNSARYSLVGVPLGMAVALLVALLVAQKLRGMALFRTIFYIPAISSGVAISMLWIYVYLPQTGLINSAFSLLGFDANTDFLNDVRLAMWALVFMSVWTGLGPRMVVFLAGLMGIPPQLYEAADLDGATKAQQFWRVTLPMLIPTTFFVMVTSTIASFQIFTPVYMMTQGGPLDSTNVVGYHIYTEAWRKFSIGSASAQSFVLLVVIASVSWFQFRAMRKQLEGYSAE